MAEFLSQEFGQIDTRLIVGLAVSVLVAVVGPPLGAVATEWLYRFRRPSGEAGSSGPGLARPQPLGSHRQPGNRPARPFQGSTPEKLARSMRCSGRVPISHYRHQRWLVAFWRAVKLYLFPVKTLPKSAFTAVDWRYEPSALTGLAAGHPYCGGFELRVRLHRHENRYHLRRSLQVGGLRARSRRLVVIASARDIFDPESQHPYGGHTRSAIRQRGRCWPERSSPQQHPRRAPRRWRGLRRCETPPTWRCPTPRPAPPPDHRQSASTPRRHRSP